MPGETILPTESTSVLPGAAFSVDTASALPQGFVVDSGLSSNSFAGDGGLLSPAYTEPKVEDTDDAADQYDPSQPSFRDPRHGPTGKQVLLTGFGVVGAVTIVTGLNACDTQQRTNTQPTPIAASTSTATPITCDIKIPGLSNVDTPQTTADSKSAPVLLALENTNCIESPFDQQTLTNIAEWDAQNTNLDWVKKAIDPTISRNYRGHDLSVGTAFVEDGTNQENLTPVILGAAVVENAQGAKTAIIAVGAYKLKADGTPDRTKPVTFLVGSDDKTVWVKLGLMDPTEDGDPLSSRVLIPSSFKADPTALAARINKYNASTTDGGLASMTFANPTTFQDILSGKTPGFVSSLADLNPTPETVSKLAQYNDTIQTVKQSS